VEEKGYFIDFFLCQEKVRLTLVFLGFSIENDRSGRSNTSSLRLCYKFGMKTKKKPERLKPLRSNEKFDLHLTNSNMTLKSPALCS
jgi:hypothetical protein